MDSSQPSMPHAGAGRKSWGRRLLGCALGVAGIALLSAAFLVWYFWQPPPLVCTAVVDAHTGRADILGLAFSPDGMQLASGASDGMAKVWDPIAKTERLTFLHQKETVTTLAFSPDGKTLASSGKDGMIRLWDVEGGKLRSKLEGHEGLVRSLALSPDGKLLASAGRDGTLNLWDFKSGKVLATMQEGVLGFQVVAFSPDGKTLATGGIDRNITLWDVGKVLAERRPK